MTSFHWDICRCLRIRRSSKVQRKRLESDDFQPFLLHIPVHMFTCLRSQSTSFSRPSPIFLSLSHASLPFFYPAVPLHRQVSLAGASLYILRRVPCCGPGRVFPGQLPSLCNKSHLRIRQCSNSTRSLALFPSLRHGGTKEHLTHAVPKGLSVNALPADVLPVGF